MTRHHDRAVPSQRIHISSPAIARYLMPFPPNVPFCCKRVRKPGGRPNTLVSSNGWLDIGRGGCKQGKSKDLGKEWTLFHHGVTEVTEVTEVFCRGESWPRCISAVSRSTTLSGMESTEMVASWEEMGGHRR